MQIKKFKIDKNNPHIIPGRLYVPYRNYFGALSTKFYTELRDSKRITGIRCAQCNLVYMPPRSTCRICFSKLSEWIELADEGTLLTYTIIHYSSSPSYQPLAPPYACGIIKLDGADTGLVHLLGEVALDSIKIGMRVKAVFKEQRQGNILDIKYFKPI